MRRALVLLAFMATIAHAQSYPATPNIVATKHPGWSITWTWVAPTENVDGSKITGALTYDIYQSTGGAFTKIASNVSALQYTETNLPLGIPCIYVVADEAVPNAIPSPPSELACVSVTPLSVQPNKPTSVRGY